MRPCLLGPPPPSPCDTYLPGILFTAPSHAPHMAFKDHSHTPPRPLWLTYFPSSSSHRPLQDSMYFLRMWRLAPAATPSFPASCRRGARPGSSTPSSRTSPPSAPSASVCLASAARREGASAPEPRVAEGGAAANDGINGRRKGHLRLQADGARCWSDRRRGGRASGRAGALREWVRVVLASTACPWLVAPHASQIVSVTHLAHVCVRRLNLHTMYTIFTRQGRPKDALVCSS